jgi:two-component system, sensor histidine kinase ChiS
MLRGRVLVIGTVAASKGLLEQLSTSGYFCASAEGAQTAVTVARELKPDLILLVGGGPAERKAVEALRSEVGLSDLPILAHRGAVKPESVKRLPIEDWVHSPDELGLRVEHALRAKRLVERDTQQRRRMETLLEITQAATSSLELEEVLRIAVDRIAKVVEADRCSVVLVEGSSPRLARVVASREIPDAPPFQLDLARYPELRKALETRQSVLVDDAASDPLMKEVRKDILPLGVKSVLVQPLVAHDDLLGALFLRMSRADDSFDADEREFVSAVAGALSNSVRNAQMHTALRRKRDDLELAYVDRYRELSEANRRLKELNRLKDEIIAVCSHDIRAPLQVLLGHGRLLLDANMEPAQRMSTEAIVRQGKKILDLVETLLDRGRGDGARYFLQPRLLDVAVLCQETTAELEILAAQRQVKLRAETPESLNVIGDEVKLRQVLQNLVTNALHHAKEGGEVCIRTQRMKRPDGDAVRVCVEDDGPGIPKDQRQIVFDRYHQNRPGGIGLGLSICREFIDLHGGEIWAESGTDESPTGTRLIFTLPMAERVQPTAPAREPSTVQEVPRVLVVEDEPEIAAIVAEILRTRYRVEVARDGAEGLAKARSLHPDLIVMDVFLPKLDGLDAVMALKASTDTSEIPVILLSAHQGVADKVKAMDLGAVDYLAKPFHALELLSRAERALRLSDTERQLTRSQHLLRRAGTDPESGMLDRPGFLSRLDQELSRATRYQRALALAALVPTVPVKDKVRVCAALIRQKLRAPDVLAHLGDGRFVLALPEFSIEAGRQSLLRVAQEVQEETGVGFQVFVHSVEPVGAQPEALFEMLLKQMV